jgi:Hint domain
MSSTVFTPPLSAYGFFTSEKFVNLIVGPVGSTKTSAGIVKIAYHAKQMAPGTDGIRRSRCVWVRNTNQQLQDTSIPDFLKWFPDGQAGHFEKVKMKYTLRFDDVECEVLFRGLEDANDVRRLLSLQISFAVLDEFREIHPDIYSALQGRLGRYPDKMLVPPRPEWGVDDKGNPVGGCVTDDGKPNQHLWGMTNPPDMDTFWEDLLTNPPANAAVFFQPSGLSQEADWLQYLPAGYYENLAEGKSEDWIDVYIHAKFGKSLSGRPVFSSFNRDTHVAKSPLLVMPSPLIIGVDAGLTPTATICQTDYQGRLLVHDSITGDSMGALRFIREMLKPLLVNKYAGRQHIIVIDPAAFQRAQTDERTVADIYRNEGFRVVAAKTNTITARLAAVEAFLNKTVNGLPGMLIDPGCTQLIEAVRSKYRYKINTKGERDETPDKTHPWSDLCFVAGTKVLTPDGYVPVETLAVGDRVAVADGDDYVVATGSRLVQATDLVTLRLSDGTELTCTKDHPFAVGNKSNPCFLPADMLTCNHVLVSVEDGVWASGVNPTRQSGRWSAFARSAARGLSALNGKFAKARAGTAQRSAIGWGAATMTASSWMACGSPALAATGTTGTSGLTKLRSPSIVTSGKNTTDQCLSGIKSTTSMATRATTSLGTLSSCGPKTTPENIYLSGLKAGQSTLKPLLRQLAKLQRLGTRLLKGVSGTGKTPFARPLVVVSKVYPSAGQRVYNVTTSRTHTYYAGPALVHNCDSLQYACLHADNGASIGARVLTSSRREVKSVSYSYV